MSNADNYINAVVCEDYGCWSALSPRALWSSGSRQSLPRDWLLVVSTGFGWWLPSSRPHPVLLVISSLCNRMILGYRGPPSGDATFVSCFWGFFLQGVELKVLGSPWLPMMASSFPLPCGIFSPPSYGWIPFVWRPLFASLILPVVWWWVVGFPGLDPVSRMILCCDCVSLGHCVLGVPIRCLAPTLYLFCLCSCLYRVDLG